MADATSSYDLGAVAAAIALAAFEAQQGQPFRQFCATIIADTGRPDWVRPCHTECGLLAEPGQEFCQLCAMGGAST